MHVAAQRLCYLRASKVLGPTGVLSAFDVRDCHDLPLGSVDGVLIDPSARQLRYLVIESAGCFEHHRYLLPFDGAATLHPHGHSLRLEMVTAGFTALDEFDTASAREFTEEDAIAPTLARYLA